MNSSIGNVTNSLQRKVSNLFSDNKDILIIVLSVLLILSILGVHFFHWIVEAMEKLIDNIIRLLGTLFAGVSYSAGEVINVSSDTISNAAKGTIDLGNGAVNDIGNVLKSGSVGDLVTPPVRIHGYVPTQGKKHPIPTQKLKKKKHHKDDNEHDDDSDHDDDDKKESMSTMLSPYVFTAPTGYTTVRPTISGQVSNRIQYGPYVA